MHVLSLEQGETLMGWSSCAVQQSRDCRKDFLIVTRPCYAIDKTIIYKNTVKAHQHDLHYLVYCVFTEFDAFHCVVPFSTWRAQQLTGVAQSFLYRAIRMCHRTTAEAQE